MATLTKKDLLEAIEDMPMDAEVKKAVVKDKILHAFRILRIICDKQNNKIVIC